jgi:hypothetical protein
MGTFGAVFYRFEEAIPAPQSGAIPDGRLSKTARKRYFFILIKNLKLSRQ